MGRLPDFLIIGAYKCGTTSLVEYLRQHPQVFLPGLQEPNYFAYEADSTSTSRKPEVDWGGIYRRPRARTLDQYQGLFEGAPPAAAAGECSPEYLRSPSACPRIAATVPGAKLVALLRNPVDRAYSDYQAFVRDGVEKASFEEAIRRPYSAEPGHQYLETGFYGRQLRPYVETFPREQLRVLLTDDLAHDGDRVLQDLCAWLGVPRGGYRPDLANTHNPSGRPANPLVALAYRGRRRLRPYVKPLAPAWLQSKADRVLAAGLRRETMAPQTRRELVDTYRDDVRLLEELSGRDLSGWLA